MIVGESPNNHQAALLSEPRQSPNRLCITVAFDRLTRPTTDQAGSTIRNGSDDREEPSPLTNRAIQKNEPTEWRCICRAIHAMQNAVTLALGPLSHCHPQIT